MLIHYHPPDSTSLAEGNVAWTCVARKPPTSGRRHDIDQSVRRSPQSVIRGQEVGAEGLGKGDVAGVVGRAAVPELPDSTAKRDVAMANKSELVELIDSTSAGLDRQPSSQRPTTHNSDDLRIDQLGCVRFSDGTKHLRDPSSALRADEQVDHRRGVEHDHRWAQGLGRSRAGADSGSSVIG